MIRCLFIRWEYFAMYNDANIITLYAIWSDKLKLKTIREHMSYNGLTVIRHMSTDWIKFL